MAAKFFTGLPLDGPDPECVRGHGEAALAAVPVGAAPRPGDDHSHRTSPLPAPPRPVPSRPVPSRPVPVTIGRGVPTSTRPVSACEDDPLAGFDPSAVRP